MPAVFEYRETGRRPLVWVALGVALFLLWLAARHDAPWYIWLLWVPATASLVYQVIANPVSGLRIDVEGLTLSPWRSPRRVLLSDIVRVEITDWSDSTDVALHLSTGEVLRAFSGDVPPIAVLERELRARGVAVERS